MLAWMVGTIRVRVATLSPQAWGRTAVDTAESEEQTVVPTAVGMHREDERWSRRLIRCPHRRGDGPVERFLSSRRLRLSPQPWGWSAAALPQLRQDKNVPTAVGMDRWNSRWPWSARSCPHSRGDGPGVLTFSSWLLKLSPQPWGWTNHGLLPAAPHLVVPTGGGWIGGIELASLQAEVVLPGVGTDPPLPCTRRQLWLSHRVETRTTTASSCG